MQDSEGRGIFFDAESVGSVVLDSWGELQGYAGFWPPNFGAIFAKTSAKIAVFEGCDAWTNPGRRIGEFETGQLSLRSAEAGAE